jgi:uncharacterized membrane-anchored protein
MKRGMIVAALHCCLVLTLLAKLEYDRATCPRIWVKTAPYDPEAPIRGRYVSLSLAPDPGTPFSEQLRGQRIAYFIPEHATDPSRRSANEELWSEVTIPHRGPARPIRLGVKRNGQLTPIELR